MLGAPVRCDQAIKGRAELRGEDGSVLRLSASEWITWTYITDELPIPVLRLTAGGKRADLAYRLGSRLGRLMLTRASTPAVTAISVDQADVSLVHRHGVTAMRVRRGTVVAGRLTHQTAPDAIKRYCGRARPTIRCLSRIRYRFGRSGKIERARVVRAGQTVRFKRARGVARPV